MDFWNDNTTFITQKMKNVNSKKCQSNVKKERKNIASSNEKFIDEVHWNFPYIY